MENKTAEEILNKTMFSLEIYLPRASEEEMLAIEAMKSYASLQCAEMKKENERLKSVLEKIKKGVGQLQDEAKYAASPDGRFGQRAEDRNYGIEAGAKLVLTMISLIEEKEDKVLPHDTINKP